MYKDKNRQYRAKLKGITGITRAEAGSVILSVIPSMILKDKAMIQSHNPIMVGYEPPR